MENIFLSNTKEAMPYTSPRGGGGGPQYPILNRPLAHVRKLKSELKAIINNSQEQVATIQKKEGIYLEVSGKQGYDLNYKSLEAERSGIHLLNVKKKDNLIKATIFVPQNKTTNLLHKFDRFEDTVGGNNNPKNNDLVRSIDTIREADIESFWHGPAETIPASNIRVWCEVWLSTESNNDGDFSDYKGHGTGMAGVALYHDLNQLLVSHEVINIPYRIESSKILRREPNTPELYGALTAQGVLFNEIENPDKNRSVCMAITTSSDEAAHGIPTSWSGAIDEIVAGVNNENKRLMYVSAGNIHPLDMEYTSNYVDMNINSCVENPGQSWNALTVGAYNSKINIDDTAFYGYQPVADTDELSPYSKTSIMWDNKWPVKPEILMEGGNMVWNGTSYDSCDDLSLLTTKHTVASGLFSTIWGTSAATAQASKLSAEIYCKYPNSWPETIRALMVHSARWTDKMKRQFLSTNTPNKTEIRTLLRTCGYGIPDLQRAVSCQNNYVNMIIEEELQPFTLNRNSQVVTNELHIHKLPWPKEVLELLGPEEVELRVTLSYYIEPSPGNIGWKEKYTYQSCGLRFELKNSMESLDDFKKRINQAARSEDASWRNELSSSASWYLGVNNRNVGSIHSDFMCVPAVDISSANGIAVYPVGGWWKNRKRLKRYNDKIRYSLIISLSTRENDVDLYTPIITEIQMPTMVAISHT